MNRFAIVPFRLLAERWYNEFLPRSVGDKAVFVENASIVYVNSIPLEGLKRDSLKFLAEQAISISTSSEATLMLVQEPKPADNIRLMQKIAQLERMLKGETRDRILNLANRRYVVSSRSILLSQEKELDDFMAEMFNLLSRLRSESFRTYSSQNLPFHEVKSLAGEFFPKRLLADIEFPASDGDMRVESSNDVLQKICSVLSLDSVQETKRMQEFASRCLKTAKKEFESLI